MEEIWENVSGYEGKYQVSNLGKIKSLNYNNTHKERILNPKINKGGYLEVKLSINNKAKDFSLARLVIEAFTNIELDRNIVILYKDGNKQNCALNNLYLTTRGAYQEFTYDKGHRPVIYVEYNGKKVTIKELSEITGISQRTIEGRLRAGWNAYECEMPERKNKYGKRRKDV